MCHLRDMTPNWEDLLTDLKESNPIEIAEYVIARGISDEPAFAWWVPYTLRQCGNYFFQFEVRSFEVSRNPPWTYTCKVNHGNFDPLLTTFLSLKFEVRDFSTIHKKNIIGNFDENDVYCVSCAIMAMVKALRP